MKRKRFSINDRNGAVRYHLHGVSIAAHFGLVELLDIDSSDPASEPYVKAIIGLGDSESVVETYDLSAEATV